MKKNTLTRQVGGNHYRDFVIQPAEFINKNRLQFAEGNAIKYIVRASKKGGKEDLLKAKHYICLLYTSPSPRDRQKSRMPSSA